jgi:hypothetical protein
VAAAALPRDRSAVWLRNAAIGPCALTAASAAVSFTAQYRTIYADRRLAVVAGLRPRLPTPPLPSSPVSASPWRCTAAGDPGAGAERRSVGA